MVSLEKLSNSNFENFKDLNLERFSSENYDKNFFEYYDNERFFLKIFLKKFVKVFKYEREIIGYIWYEIPVEIPVRVWSLYVKPEYINILNKDILKSFDNTILSYEANDNEINNYMLTKLGFKKIKNSVLMNMNTNSYEKEKYVKRLKEKLEKNPYAINKLNLFYDYNFFDTKITVEKMVINSDEALRCEIQNSIFSNISRAPLEIEDIENDIQQDYYIEDLSLFIKVNGIAIGYGQIIYNRNMYTVVNFGILKEFRGFGFGKILLNELIKLCKEMDITELYIRVEEKNFNALKLYNWIGFLPKLPINKWERK